MSKFGSWSFALLLVFVQLALREAILLHEEASYGHANAFTTGAGSQRDAESRMRLLYVERQTLRNASVLCNDGSPAAFYFRKSEASRNWLIFLEGGGYCYDLLSCAQRKTYDPNLCSSQSWHQTRLADGVVSGDDSSNPLFANESVVLVPYCSSDLWSGNSLHRSNTSDFYFMGALIVKEVVKQLLASENLAQANRVLLAGKSAGGIGALLHFQNVKGLIESHARRNRLHPPQVRVFADSAWFLDISEQDMSKMDRVLPTESARSSTTDRKRKTAASASKSKTIAHPYSVLGPRRARPAIIANLRKSGSSPSSARTANGTKRKQQCVGSMACPFALKETIKLASGVWKPDLPRECTRLRGNEKKPWRCFYPFVLLRSMQKTRNPIPVFILQYMYDRSQMVMDSGFGHLQLGPAYLEALRDKMRTTLLKTTPLFVGAFIPACYGHEVVNRHDWWRWKINNSSVIDAIKCWEQRLDERHERAMGRLARRNLGTTDLNDRAYRLGYTQNPEADAVETTSSNCESRLFELDSYPLSNSHCPRVLTSFSGVTLDRIGMMREFGYSEVQINRLLNLNKVRQKMGNMPKFTLPNRIPLPR